MVPAAAAGRGFELYDCSGDGCYKRLGSLTAPQRAVGAARPAFLNDDDNAGPGTTF